MIRRPPRSTRTDTLFPYTTLFRSNICLATPANIRAAARARASSPLVGWRQDSAQERLSRKINVFLQEDTWKAGARSEEHTSELQSLMRISYAVFCLKKKKETKKTQTTSKALSIQQQHKASRP